MVLPDGHFYIGSTTKELKNYNGSGAEWQRYKKGKGFTNQDITKEIIFQNFENEEEMRDFERKEIEKNIKDSFCLNRNIQAGCSKEIARKHACPECGGKGGNHFKGCLKYKEPESCPECRGKAGVHRKGCSKAAVCQECGSGRGHKKTCSQYKVKPCPECGGVKGHFDFCSHSSGKCEYCGYSLRSHRHAKDCPLYKEPKKCSECGGLDGKHLKSCSKAVICPECGGGQGLHKKDCSKAIFCSECFGKGGHHKKTCSKYKVPESCPECRSKYNHHKTCSKYKRKEY